MTKPATVSGRVTDANGEPEDAVMVRINVLDVGTTSIANGTYELVIPAERVPVKTEYTITASRVGITTSSKQITIGPESVLTQNFVVAADAVGS